MTGEELFNEQVENELCEQLIKIVTALGFDVEEFDEDASQMFCMVKMATAAADKLVETK